ncbi:MAG TPA: hypothetical protein VGI19_11895 [Candidatus Cybelea sp.]|jgi:hypothetical protein
MASLLSGCGGLNGPPFASSEDRATAVKATSGALLYVANELAANGVTILTFPQGAPVATITNIGGPTGICADASGNVWVSAYDDGTHKYHLYKFVHGGTTPVETLRVPGGAWGCAVDPATGNLATWVPFAGSAGRVDVFPGARKGKPVVYETDFEPVSATYDNRGNIFADGFVNSGDFIFEELAKGSGSFAPIRLSKAGGNPGSVQWDGKYVVVGVGYLSEGPTLERVHVSGDRGNVVDSVHLQGLGSPARFWIQDGDVVASQSPHSARRIGLYDYPAGGKRLDAFAGFYKPLGMTVSVPPK